MNRRLLAIFMMTLMLAQSAGQVSNAFAAEEVVFSVVLDKDQVKRSEPIEVRFKLQNRGDAGVYVNKRFKLGSKKAPSQQREVFLEAWSPANSELESIYPNYPTGLPKSEFFEWLEPGKEVVSESKTDLRNYFDFKEPGIYRIAATYENLVGPEIGLKVFSQRRTAKVTLKVVE